MPIIIMPNGEMVDSVTGNPVNTPTPMPENMGQFLANRKFPNTEKPMTTMPMMRDESKFGNFKGENLSVMEKMQMLMDMGLTEGEAIDAIAMEESAGSIEPRKFGNEVNLERPGGMMGGTPDMLRQGGTGMGALGGVPMLGQSVMDRPDGMMGGQPRRTPMPTPMPNDMGADRTMNPMDRITSRNAPST